MEIEGFPNFVMHNVGEKVFMFLMSIHMHTQYTGVIDLNQ